MTAEEVPPGFERHLRSSGLTAPWEPLYSRRIDGVVVIGFRASPAHANSRSLVHGGLLSALADNAMGLSCGSGLEDAAGLVTVSLSVDFVSSARLAQWVEIRPTVIKAGGSLCFASAIVYADDTVCARASAVFRALRRQ